MDTFFPATIIAYRGYIAPYFPANNFIYFRAMMLAFMLLGQARKCVTNIASVSFFVERHIGSWERFISQNQWDLRGVQTRLVNLIIEQLGDNLIIYGGYLASVDTTLVSKVQGKMPGVPKWHDHSSNPERGDYIIGHHWAIAALLGATTLTGQLTIPCAFPFWQTWYRETQIPWAMRKYSQCINDSLLKETDMYEIRITPQGANSPRVTLVMQFCSGCTANGTWQCSQSSLSLGGGRGRWTYSRSLYRIHFYDDTRQGQRILWIDGIRVYDPRIIYRGDRGTGQVLVTSQFNPGYISALVTQGREPRDRRLISP